MNQATKDYIKKHAKEDVRQLALQGTKDPEVENDPILYYNVYRFVKGEMVNTRDMDHLYMQVASPELIDYDIANSSKYTYVVTAVDHFNNEGKAAKKSFKIKLK